jgi:hypothetical protein
MASFAEARVGLDAAEPQPGMAGLELWSGVDRLIERAPDADALTAHRLHLLAAHQWGRAGREVPAELIEERRNTALLSLISGIVLQKVRDACEGPVVLLKGPEAAAYYPDPSVRPFRDLDLLVPNAIAVQNQLLAAGFELTGEEHLYRDIHHLRPVVWPDLPLLIEVHERPKWVEGIEPPAVEELVAAAVPSATAVAGIEALPPAHHALVLAAHGWAHVPFRRLLDLVDVAAVHVHAEEDEVRALAQAWGLGRLWRSTDAAIEALFYGGATPLSLRTWGRNLLTAQERTVLQSHLGRLISAFWALPPHRALLQTRRAIGQQLSPEPGETWRIKLTRSGRALRHAFSSVTQHDRAVEASGLQAPSMKEVRDDGSTPSD